MKRVLLDTNLYVDWINRGSREELLVGPGYLRLLSSVVLMELRAGATGRRAMAAVDKLARAYSSASRIATPLASVYDDAGRALRKLRARGHEVRRASFVNDTLIALTARAQGATVFTLDATDFEAIQRVYPLSLVVA
jgi:predicted nucleic acid-binding protein